MASNGVFRLRIFCQIDQRMLGPAAHVDVLDARAASSCISGPAAPAIISSRSTRLPATWPASA
jgi:hypothetical protein